jgi:hypothetical protein
MILFINVYLDYNGSSPLQMPYNRMNLSEFGKDEVFLYTLESYKTIEWSDVIIYCEVSEDFPDKENYYNKILNIFPQSKLFKMRNAYQNQWQEAIESLPDELIWYAGNHDHPYIAPNHNQLNNLIKKLEDSEEFYKGAIYSHHPDICTTIMHESIFDWKYEGDGVSSYYVSRAEAIMILNKNLFKAWWFDYEYNGAFIPRVDWVDVSCQSPFCRIYLPVKELCRHFDGHNFGAYSYENRDITALEIPKGFWDRDIKIDFYSDQRYEDRVWINPCIKDYYSVDIEGVDYKCLVEDLPLFWKNRISEIKIHQPLNKVIKKARNLALYHSANARKYMNNMMTRKGVNWGELREFRNRIPLYYLKKLFNHKA